ncbi:MAG: DNA-processing protein DprA [Microthrixaceae bacterium]
MAGHEAAVGTDAAVAAATLAGLEGIGPGLLARWCAPPGPHAAIERLLAESRPASAQVDSVRWRSWQRQLTAPDRGEATGPAGLHRTAMALAECAARAVLPGEPGYPLRLAEDAHAPGVLIRRGVADGPSTGEAVVAIIGTRRASRVGREVAHELAAELAGRGVVVVSGLARGIDAAAHRGALSVEATRTLGVIGCGPDQVYPREHERLWGEVADGGGLVGEWPPGVPPHAWRFPARNRLLAALADVVVVVESARAGGSMHTVREAIERSVPVLAVPGSVRAGASAGTNQLISEGCDPCLDVLDVLAALSRQGARCATAGTGAAGVGSAAPKRTGRRAPETGGAGQLALAVPEGGALVAPDVQEHPLDSVEPTGAGRDADEAALLDAAGFDRVSLDYLVETSGLDVASVAAAVGRLCERGVLVESEGWFEHSGRKS